MESTVKKEDVVRFWSEHPLASYEVKEKVASLAYFKGLEKIREDSSRFVMDFYRFGKFKDGKVLDVGCGPGWITFNYAKSGSNIFSIDITFQAVSIAKAYLNSAGLKSNIVNADAENIPYKDITFDFVLCDGVLHHTPDTKKGICEIYRVLKADSDCAISLYYKNILLRWPFFFLTKIIMMLLNVKFHGNKKVSLKMSLAEFGNLYDGKDNPLGRIFSRKECVRMFESAGFKVRRSKVYFFPSRLVPSLKGLPMFIRKFFDSVFGTMIFFELKK